MKHVFIVCYFCNHEIRARLHNMYRRTRTPYMSLHRQILVFLRNVRQFSENESTDVDRKLRTNNSMSPSPVSSRSHSCTQKWPHFCKGLEIIQAQSGRSHSYAKVASFCKSLEINRVQSGSSVSAASFCKVHEVNQIASGSSVVTSSNTYLS